MKIRGLIAVGALSVLAACTTPSFSMPPGTPDFRAGYAEGCDAGYAVAGSPFYDTLEKAEPPAKGDPRRLGWLVGHDRCKRNYQRIQKTVSSIFGPP